LGTLNVKVPNQALQQTGAATLVSGSSQLTKAGSFGDKEA
jgi:hypothetical protein